MSFATNTCKVHHIPIIFSLIPSEMSFWWKILHSQQIGHWIYGEIDSHVIKRHDFCLLNI